MWRVRIDPSVCEALRGVEGHTSEVGNMQHRHMMGVSYILKFQHPGTSSLLRPVQSPVPAHPLHSLPAPLQPQVTAGHCPQSSGIYSLEENDQGTSGEG